MNEAARQPRTGGAGPRLDGAVAVSMPRDEVEQLRRERDEARELLGALVAGLRRASFRHGAYIDGLRAAMVAVERWSTEARR
jgi:hypothetical protein